MKKTAMMTSGDPAERQAALAARVHRLSDPLAAMGQRPHGARLQHERRARLALLALTLSATMAVTGVIATVDGPPANTDAGIAYQSTTGQPERTVHIRTKSS